jgi:hypothetical protein
MDGYLHWLCELSLVLPVRFVLMSETCMSEGVLAVISIMLVVEVNDLLYFYIASKYITNESV